MIAIVIHLGRPDNRSSQPDDGRRDVEHVGADKLVKFLQIHKYIIYKYTNTEHTNTEYISMRLGLTLDREAAQYIVRREALRQTSQTCKNVLDGRLSKTQILCAKHPECVSKSENMPPWTIGRVENIKIENKSMG